MVSEIKHINKIINGTDLEMSERKKYVHFTMFLFVLKALEKHEYFKNISVSETILITKEEAEFLSKNENTWGHLINWAVFVEHILKIIYPRINSFNSNSVLSKFVSGLEIPSDGNSDLRDIGLLVNQFAHFNADTLGPILKAFYEATYSEKNGLRLNDELFDNILSFLPSLTTNSRILSTGIDGCGMLLTLINKYSNQDYTIDHYEVNREELSKVAFVQLVLGISNWNLYTANILNNNSEETHPEIRNKYDLIVSVPPIGKGEREKLRSEIAYPGRDFTLNYMQLFDIAVKTDGRIITVVPDSFLITKMAENIRSILLDKYRLTVVHLPNNLFDQTHIKTSLIAMEASDNDDSNTFIDLRGDSGNEESVKVRSLDIKKTGYLLDINRYRDIHPSGLSKKEYEVSIDNLIDIEEKILKELIALKNDINGRD